MKKNKNDVEEFIPWSFNELGVDTINIRRVFTNSYTCTQIIFGSGLKMETQYL